MLLELLTSYSDEKDRQTMTMFRDGAQVRPEMLDKEQAGIFYSMAHNFANVMGVRLCKLDPEFARCMYQADAEVQKINNKNKLN